VYLFVDFFENIIIMIMIMIEMQYSGTALLFNVTGEPTMIPHRNNGTMHPTYIFIVIYLALFYCFTESHYYKIVGYKTDWIKVQ